MIIVIECTSCHKLFEVRSDQFVKRKTKMCKSCVVIQRNKKPWSEEQKQKIKGSGNHFWKNGKTHGDGYVMVRCSNHPKASRKGDYVREHDLIVEKSIGRYLQENEVVHHINRNKSDNRLENLVLMDKAVHHSLHSLERWHKVKIGMLWFDDDPKANLKTKIQRAIDHYIKKYDTKPNLCYVHPSMAEEVSIIEVRTNRYILPNHFWVGVKNESA